MSADQKPKGNLLAAYEEQKAMEKARGDLRARVTPSPTIYKHLGDCSLDKNHRGRCEPAGTIPIETPIVDQPPPQQYNTPAMWDLVIEDMRLRSWTGTKRYGTELKAFNGRDALVDAYQEVLDLAVYLRQEIYERGTPPPPYDIPNLERCKHSPKHSSAWWCEYYTTQEDKRL